MRRGPAARARVLCLFGAIALSACGVVLGIEDLRAPPNVAGEAGADGLAPGDDAGCRELETSCASNDENCAYCGHRCGPGSHCVEHTCTPVEVAKLGVPSYGPGCALARDDARLFVATTETLDAGFRTVVREMLDDGRIDPTPAAIVDDIARPAAFALDHERFYLLGQAQDANPRQSIVSCPRVGGACMTHATSDSTRYFRAFARSAAGLFVADSIGRLVWQIPFAADASASVLVNDTPYMAWDIVADDGAVYWSGQHPWAPDASYPLWRVMRVDAPDAAVDSTDAARLLTERNDLDGLAMDGEDLVFGIDGGLARMAKTGGAITSLPFRDSARVSLATADESRLYAFVTSSNGEWSVYERARCGNNAVAIARLPAEPANAATLGDSVYVCTLGASLGLAATLLRVAK